MRKFIFFILLFPLMSNADVHSRREARRLSKELRNLKSFGFVRDTYREYQGIQSIIQNNDYETGIPTSLFEMSVMRYSPVKLWQMGFTPIPKDAVSYDHSDRPERLPLGLSSFQSGPSKVVNNNCFSCHAGVVASQVVLGLPNTNFDIISNKILADEARMIYRGENMFLQGMKWSVDTMFLSEDESSKLDQFIDYFDQIVRPNLNQTVVRGDNPGPYIVWRLLAKLQDTENGLSVMNQKEKSELEKRMLEGVRLPQVDPQPWWNTKYKDKAFWNADFAIDAKSSFVLNQLDHGQGGKRRLEERIKETDLHLDLVRKTEAPPYPKRDKIDREKASLGYQIYSSKVFGCAVCHGDHDENGKLIQDHYVQMEPVDVGTDPEYYKLINGFEDLYQKGAEIFAGDKTASVSVFREHKGYSPPPLVGIWASAPYFHNGSVATLEQVLNTKKRLKIWKKSIYPSDYNFDEVGLKVSEVSELRFDQLQEKWGDQVHNSLNPNVLEFRRIYHTDQFDRSNEGHDFGDKLNDEMREALIEYLKLF